MKIRVLTVFLLLLKNCTYFFKNSIFKREIFEALENFWQVMQPNLKSEIIFIIGKDIFQIQILVHVA